MSGFCSGMVGVMRQTLRQKVEKRIAEAQDDVFLPREFRGLGGEDQVLRVLRGLVNEGRLMRLGYGVYGRARVSRLTGELVLDAKGGFQGAARRVLDKLGVPWEQTYWQKEYNECRTTQVPVNPAVKVKGRFSRKLRYEDRDLLVER
jgi:hypothetical protein